MSLRTKRERVVSRVLSARLTGSVNWSWSAEIAGKNVGNQDSEDSNQR